MDRALPGSHLITLPGGNHPPLTHVPPPSATNGSGVWQVDEVGAGGGVAAGGAPIPGGSQPPFTHVPPPIAVNGSGVAHPDGDVGGGVGGGGELPGGGVPLPPADVMPGGSHPPFRHVPPPIAANGSGVAHPDGDVGGGGVGGGGELPGGGVPLPPVEVMPGGSHPPFTHVPPPIAANGSGVAHPDDDVGGGVGGGELPGGAVPLPPVDVMPGGSHPPFTQVPPPIAANGSGVAHPDDDVGAGGGGELPGGVPPVGVPAGTHPPFTHVPPPIAAKGSGPVQPPSRTSLPPLTVVVRTTCTHDVNSPSERSHSGASERAAARGAKLSALSTPGTLIIVELTAP